MNDDLWPALPYEAWKDTYDTLHMWSQMVGKVALRLAPPENHGWGIALHLTERGMATRLLPFGERSFSLELDFIEVFVDTPLEECERRDAKGMYAMARRGEISGWTGIDDPYEAPAHAELVLDTVRCSAEDNARRIVDYLALAGFVRRDGAPSQ